MLSFPRRCSMLLLLSRRPFFSPFNPLVGGAVHRISHCSHSQGGGLLLLSFRSFLFFWLCVEHCGIFVPQQRIEPAPSAVKEQPVNHWTTREFMSLRSFWALPNWNSIHLKWLVNNESCIKDFKGDLQERSCNNTEHNTQQYWNVSIQHFDSSSKSFFRHSNN